MDELENLGLSEGHPEKTFSMNANLNTEQKKVVKTLILRHASTFAWKLADMPEIDPQAMSHKLNVSQR